MTLTPDDAIPGCDDLDPTIHEHREAPVSLRPPSALAVIALVAMDAGVPMCVAKGWLSNLNFADAEIV
jgi:hypothetical protein